MFLREHYQPFIINYFRRGKKMNAKQFQYGKNAENPQI